MPKITAQLTADLELRLSSVIVRCDTALAKHADPIFMRNPHVADLILRIEKIREDVKYIFEEMERPNDA